MNHSRSRRLRLVTLIACAVLLLGGVLAARYVYAVPEAAHALDAARARWAARPFARYQMRVDDLCEQEVTVEGVKVVHSSQTFCGLRGRTIDDLFALIERDDTVTYSCVARGCTCDDVISVRASYDPQLGYPTAIEVRVRARPNPAHADFWRQMWATRSIPRCSMMMEGSKTIRIMAFKPLY